MSALGQESASSEEKVEVVTFGCRLNMVESQTIRHLAGQGGQGNLVVVNTCAVTAESTRQARQTIRRLKRERPEARIVVTGCAAQIEPDSFAAMPEVAHVMGNAEKTRATSWDFFAARKNVAAIAEAVRHGNAASPLLAAIEGHTRAFLSLQNGCDHSCTFCVIPAGRGPSRSAPTDTVVAQARKFVETGHKELVLTGVDLTSWGADLPGAPKLGQLVRLLQQVLHPHDAGIVDQHVQCWKLCRYLRRKTADARSIFHIQYQRSHARISGCDRIQRYLASPGHDHLVTELMKSLCQPAPNAGRAARNKNRIARHLHGLPPVGNAVSA